MLRPRFRELLLQALRYYSEHGPPTDAELNEWLMRVHAAIDFELPTDAETKRVLASMLQQVYDRNIKGGIMKRVPVSRYQLDRVAPYLRAELDRRIFAGVELIKINKQQRTAQTLRRFAGWLSSVPLGGSAAPNLRAAASEIMKPVRQIKFEARRVAIDQGHKLNASVAAVVAQGEGAIAAIWHDRGEHDRTYDARPAHLARSGKLFLIRDSWAIQDGLIRKGARPYTDEFEHVAELPYCSCTYEYITSPGLLPEELLTTRGRQWVKGGAA